MCQRMYSTNYPMIEIPDKQLQLQKRLNLFEKTILRCADESVPEEIRDTLNIEWWFLRNELGYTSESSCERFLDLTNEQEKRMNLR